MQISAISLNVNSNDVFFNSKVEQILPNVTTEFNVDDLQKNLTDIEKISLWKMFCEHQILNGKLDIIA